ncbi:hypothetical protein H920_03906 [Fukomys damarensis]|uniref:Uncharacterized protein n=1 Tax=Fukomys damarensis TaxID=885580 RepID=A0A091DW63_FUKDA|nr:hypothetical protein H920_03906 [Fukomys damarensis]
MELDSHSRQDICDYPTPVPPPLFSLIPKTLPTRILSHCQPSYRLQSDENKILAYEDGLGGKSHPAKRGDFSRKTWQVSRKRVQFLELFVGTLPPGSLSLQVWIPFLEAHAQSAIWEIPDSISPGVGRRDSSLEAGLFTGSSHDSCIRVFCVLCLPEVTRRGRIRVRLREFEVKGRQEVGVLEQPGYVGCAVVVLLPTNTFLSVKLCVQ